MGSQVQKFRLICEYSELFESCIDAWILSAVRRDVKELDLIFPISLDDVNLPSWLFKCEGLVSFSLMIFCRVGVPNSVRLSSLLSLSISYAILVEEFIPALLDGCPLLEELNVSYCELENLLILLSSSSSGLPLKRLTIVYFHDGFANDPDLEISAPNLEIFKLSGFTVYNNSMRNLVFLREAYLDFAFTSADPESHSTLESWLEHLHHVKVLELSRRCVLV